MRRSAIVILVLLIPAILSGCAGNFELDRELIVEAVGIDLRDGRILLTLQALDAESHPAGKEGSSDGSVTAVWKASGATVSEAAEKIASDSGKSIAFSQNRVLTLGKTAAGRMRETLDFFLRSYQFRNGCLLAFADSAEAVVCAETGGGRIPAVRLQKILETGGVSGQCAPVRLCDFINRLDSGGAFAPTVGLNDKKEPTLVGTALFRDDALCGTLNENETQLLSILTCRAKNGAMTVEGANGTIALDLLRSAPVRKNGELLEVRCFCDTAEAVGSVTASAAAREQAAEGNLTRRAKALVEKLYARGIRLPAFLREDAPPEVRFRVTVRR